MTLDSERSVFFSFMTRTFVFLGAVLRYMIDNDTLCTCMILVFLVLYRTFVALNLVLYVCCSAVVVQIAAHFIT